MTRPTNFIGLPMFGAGVLAVYLMAGMDVANSQDELSGGSYAPVVDEDFQQVFDSDRDEKDEVMERQQGVLETRYDLSDKPSPVMMSGGRKAVQEGVRVRLPSGVSWDELNDMTPEQIRKQDLFPKGFMPLPHAKHPTGGMVFPQQQIDAIAEAEDRDLERFDVAFDLPEHLTPEFPPPLFLTNRPDLGDVTGAKY
ncbi:hypothetical protein [Kineobactrum salinum]|uniref:hypothetical protein n=1 Tax=Kineobactrum salinum TaxID=2708301 RepID=UPI0018D6991A|nr:hypothetical protein [Kineobactrum salinum]